MSTAARRLLRLYPRPWRERYGEELLALVGESALRPQQVIDIVSGAIDAWLSADVRRAIRVASSEGGHLMLKWTAACERTDARPTIRDSLIGAGVMIAASALFMVIGVSARRSGWTATGEAVTSIAFPCSLMLSMPFWLMKGQPWRAQVAIVGGTLLLLVAMGWLGSAT